MSQLYTPFFKTQFRVVAEYQAPYADPLQAKAGDDVSVDLIRETDIAGWVWCTNSEGKRGWVPIAKVEVMEEES